MNKWMELTKMEAVAGMQDPIIHCILRQYTKI